MEDIGTLLQCYNLFSTAYAYSADVQNALVESYKNIVSFWQKASRLLDRKPLTTFLIGIVKPLAAKWAKCRQGLQNDKDRVMLIARATEADSRRQKDLEHRQSKTRKRIIEWIK